jgi:hypothetical protein
MFSSRMQQPPNKLSLPSKYHDPFVYQLVLPAKKRLEANKLQLTNINSNVPRLSRMRR